MSCLLFYRGSRNLTILPFHSPTTAEMILQDYHWGRGWGSNIDRVALFSLDLVMGYAAVFTHLILILHCDREHIRI